MEYNKIYNVHYEKLKDTIQDGSVDLVLTDIPYLISRETNFKGIKEYTSITGETTYSGMKYEFDNWSESELEDYIKECYRVLKIGGNIIIWSSWQLLGKVEETLKNMARNSNAEIKKERVGVWIKNDVAPFNKDIMPVSAMEMFLVCAKGENATFNYTEFKHKLVRAEFESDDKSSVHTQSELSDIFMRATSGYERLFYMYPKKINNKIHPTQKPLEIIKHLIYTYSNEGDVVYDGLMGSGVTAQASRLTNRRYIGAEINKKYYDELINRIKSTQL